MSAPKTRPRGLQGSAEQLLCPGAPMAKRTPTDDSPEVGDGPAEQSGEHDTGGTTRVRIRLSEKHAKRWLALPLGVREHAAAVVFGLGVDGVDLQEVLKMASELREARLAVQNALRFALLNDAPLDVRRVESAAERINHILGGKP
jgi:hypothetical protein